MPWHQFWSNRASVPSVMQIPGDVLSICIRLGCSGVRAASSPAQAHTYLLNNELGEDARGLHRCVGDTIPSGLEVDKYLLSSQVIALIGHTWWFSLGLHRGVCVWVAVLSFSQAEEAFPVWVSLRDDWHTGSSGFWPLHSDYTSVLLHHALLSENLINRWSRGDFWSFIWLG